MWAYAIIWTLAVFRKKCRALQKAVLQHFQVPFLSLPAFFPAFLHFHFLPELPMASMSLLNACIALLCRRFFCWMCKKEESDYISTRSTLTPQGSVASSNEFCMTWLIVSRSDRISAKFLVPNTFRRVVAANSRVEWLQSKKEKVWSTAEAVIFLLKFIGVHSAGA